MQNQILFLQQVEGWKRDAGSFFFQGFERAKSQVRFLVAGVDLTLLDPTKVVKDGALVEDSDDDDDQPANAEQAVDLPMADDPALNVTPLETADPLPPAPQVIIL